MLGHFLVFIFLSVLQFPRVSWGSVSKPLDQFYVWLAQGTQMSQTCASPKGASPSLSSEVDPKCLEPQASHQQLSEQAEEISETLILTGLAQTKLRAVDCASQEVEQVLASSQMQKTYAEDAKAKVEMLGQALKERLRLGDEALPLSRSKKPEDREKLKVLQSELQRVTAKILLIESLIPYSKTGPVSEVIQKHLNTLTDPQSTKTSVNFDQFDEDYRKSLLVLKKELRSDQSDLQQAVKTSGNSLDRGAREALLQDETLLKDYKNQNPKLAAAAAGPLCELDKKYGAGAKSRDNAMMLGSVVLTGASLGVGAGIKGLSHLGFAASGAKALQTATVLGRTAAVFDIATGLKGFQEACWHKSANVQATCEAYSLKSLEKNNCALSAILDGGGATLAGAGLAGAALSTQKSRQILSLETKSSSASSKLPALRAHSQEEFLKTYPPMKFSSRQDVDNYNRVVDSMKPGDGRYRVTLSNKDQQKLNTRLGENSKAKVDAANNRFFELMDHQLATLQKEFPDVKIEAKAVSYKDYDFIISGNITPEFIKRKDQLFREAADQLAEDLVRLGVVENSQGANWFRGAAGPTNDTTNAAYRASRESSEARIHYYDEKSVQQHIQDNWAQNRVFSRELDREMLQGKSSFLEMTPSEAQALMNRRKYMQYVRGADGVDYIMPGREILGMAKKESDTARLTKKINNRLKTDFSENEVMAMQNLQDFSEMVSPNIPMTNRTVVSAREARCGAVNSDACGMGGANAEGTMMASLRADNPREQLDFARAEEKNVTREFSRAANQQRKIALNYLEKKKGVVTEWRCSGDDCVGIFSMPVQSRYKAELIQRLSKVERPAGARYSFISDQVVEASHRPSIGLHGEEIEKALRSRLEKVVSNEVLQKLTFGIDMKGNSVGVGQVDVLVGNSRTRLTPEQHLQIREALKEAVEEINKKKELHGGNVAHYTTAP